MSLAASITPTGRPRLGLPLAIIVIGATALAVSFAFRSMAVMWGTDDYSYAWLILPLAALLAVHRFPQAPERNGAWLGLGAASVALLMMAVGWAAQNLSFSIYGWILGIASLVWTSLGWRGLRRLAGPIIFLAFMIPLPVAFYTTLSAHMQLVSSQLGVGLLELLGVQVSLDGNIIDLANGRLEVAQACNGLRFLFPLLSIAVLLAILARGPLWQRGLLVASALPIAIGVNSLRLALTGLLVDAWGMGWAEGLPHEIMGLLGFALCLVLLAAVLVGSSRLSTRRTSAIELHALLPNRAALGRLLDWPSPGPFLVASWLLLAGSGLVLALPAPTVVTPDRRPLALFPMTLANWIGTPTALDPATLKALGLTDYVMADYRNPLAHEPAVNFYVAYYGSQRFGLQIHSPRLCIPGEGWQVVEDGIATIPFSDGSTMKVNRSVIEKRGARQIVYYWFDERGRRLTSEWDVKWARVVDSIKRSRSDGALVRLVTSVASGEDKQAETRLQEFVLLVNNDLKRYVPE